MKRILVVDDEVPIRELFGDLLRDEGYSVVFAGSGRETLRMLETQPPDMVLLDLMMMDGNGWDVLEAMRAHAHWRDIPVAILTNHGDLVRKGEFSLPFLTKPFDLERLVEVVLDAIGPATDPEQT